MDQAINARDDLSEGAESGHRNNLSGDNVADLVISLEHFPRVVLGLLVAQGDLLVLGVDVLDINIQHVANFNNVRRMFDAQPAQLGNVNHAVYAAQVNECAVAGEGFDNALIAFADLNLAPEFLFQRFLLLFEHVLDRANRSVTLLVDFADDKINLLFEQLIQRVVLGNAGQGSRNEDFDAFGDSQNAALNNIGDGAGEHFAGAGSSHYLLKAGLCIQTFFGEHDSALYVVDAHNDQLDFIALLDDVFRLQAWVAGQLGQRHIAGVFCTDIDSDLVRSNAGNDTLHLLPCICTLEGLVKHLFKGHFFFFQNLTHGFLYLLNYTNRCRSTGSNTNSTARANLADLVRLTAQKFPCRFDPNGFAAPAADIR